MIEAGIEVRTVEFEAAMQRLREGVRKGFVDPQYGTLTVQGRLLAERCQALTPPRNQKQGRDAVKRDINRAFQPLDPGKFASPSIQRIIRKDDRLAWREASQNFTARNLRDTQAIPFGSAYHKNQRDRRGRVRRNNGVVTLGPQARSVARYVREMQKRVGWARAGWNRAIMALGGTVKGAWMKRHGNTRGIFVDGRNLPDSFVRVGNDTGWGKSGKAAEGVARSALGMRARDMQTYYFRMMKVATDKAQRKAA